MKLLYHVSLMCYLQKNGRDELRINADQEWFFHPRNTCVSGCFYAPVSDLDEAEKRELSGSAFPKPVVWISHGAISNPAGKGPLQEGQCQRLNPLDYKFMPPIYPISAGLQTVAHPQMSAEPPRKETLLSACQESWKLSRSAKQQPPTSTWEWV